MTVFIVLKMDHQPQHTANKDKFVGNKMLKCANNIYVHDISINKETNSFYILISLVAEHSNEYKMNFDLFIDRFV